MSSSCLYFFKEMVRTVASWTVQLFFRADNPVTLISMIWAVSVLTGAYLATAIAFPPTCSDVLGDGVIGEEQKEDREQGNHQQSAILPRLLIIIWKMLFRKITTEITTYYSCSSTPHMIWTNVPMIGKLKGPKYQEQWKYPTSTDKGHPSFHKARPVITLQSRAVHS